MKSRRKFLCLDCSVDTGKIFEHYFLKNEVWFPVVHSNQGMLCVGCVEGRLGRKLNKHDFTDASINTAKYEAKSSRLMNRFNAE